MFTRKTVQMIMVAARKAAVTEDLKASTLVLKAAPVVAALVAVVMAAPAAVRCTEARDRCTQIAADRLQAIGIVEAAACPVTIVIVNTLWMTGAAMTSSHPHVVIIGWA